MYMRYDIAIIGSGPAGLSSAIDAKIRNKNIILFGNKEISNKVALAPSIENYLGIPNTNGKEIIEKFKNHINDLDIEITNERITAIYSMGEYFAVMSGDKMYEAKTVIMATGVEFTKPLKGEQELLGRGVGYCASCDGMLYKGKSVAVIGYNHEAIEDANYLSEIAERVYFIPMKKVEGILNPNVGIINDRVVEISKEDRIDVIMKSSKLTVDGVFVIKDSISPANLVPGLEVDGIHIKNNKQLETNIPGLFVAGDCAGKPYKYVKSAGEGQIAAHMAVEYLSKMEK
ncbi:MAG: NAD(P)/FAD-dependent oxidoreductase [Clostridium sp.]|nr:NAD(P)/FAD-dependent oxidoreductase [Clostridium sp.]MBQ8999684.1 NAD(P)/FAD-dependent oxidoreductase [Clostridium sp.]